MKLNLGKCFTTSTNFKTGTVLFSERTTCAKQKRFRTSAADGCNFINYSLYNTFETPLEAMLIIKCL